MPNLLIITKNPNTYSHTRFIESARDIGHLVDVLQTSSFSLSKLQRYDFVLHRDSGISFDDVDLLLIRKLEANGCKVLNSSSTLSLLRGKDAQSLFFERHGLAFIPTEIRRGLNQIDEIFPDAQELVIKTTRGNQGRGVNLVQRNELTKVLKNNFDRKDERYIIQPRLHFKRELRVLIFADQVQGCMQKICLSNFRANAKRSETKAVDIPEEVESMTSHIMTLFPGEFLGLDFGEEENGFKLIEINTTPGFEVFDKVFETNIAKRIWESYL